MLTPKEKGVLKLIAEDKIAADYFFGRVKDPKWFMALKEAGFFNPSANPVPIETKDGYKIEEWNVLRYLEILSHLRNFDEELIGIIKDVSQYSKNGKSIDNYRTWWFFIKILSNIPTEIIKAEVIDLIPTWLHSSFDTILQGSDLIKVLLPRFLSESSTKEDHEKAERIIKYATSVRFIDAPEGIFGETKKPMPAVAEHWLIDGLVESNLTHKIAQYCSINVLFEIATNLNRILLNKHSRSWNDIRYKGELYRLVTYAKAPQAFEAKLCLIDQEKEKKNKYITKEFPVLKTLACFEFEAKDASQFVSKILEGLKASEISMDIITGHMPNLKNNYKGIFDDYSYIWMREIGNNSKNVSLENTLAIIFRDILLHRAKISPSSYKELEDLLKNPLRYPIYLRLAIYTINKTWDKHKDLFVKYLNTHRQELLNDPDLEQEVGDLFFEHALHFLQDDKNLIATSIEMGPTNYIAQDESRYINYWKQRWYAALKADDFFAEKYNTYKNLTKKDISFNLEAETNWFEGDKTPVSVEELLTRDNAEIINSIQRYKPSDPLFSKDGLRKALQEAVRLKPEKFDVDMEAFLKSDYFTIEAVIRGLKEAWDLHKSIDWSSVLRSISRLINQDKFWASYRKEVKGGNYHSGVNWTLSSIADLLQKAVEKDSWSAPDKYIDEMIKIIDVVVTKLSLKEPERTATKGNEPVITALNSTQGKIATAIIYIALKQSRIADKQTGSGSARWDIRLKNSYEYLLKHGSYDAFTLLGQYFANFYYIDQTWTESKIHFVLASNERNFLNFVEGYLFTGKIYNEVSKKLFPVYKKALDSTFDNSYMNTRLMQYVGIIYLKGFEDHDKIINYIFKSNNPQRLFELTNYFWSQNGLIVEDGRNTYQLNDAERAGFRERILIYWKRVYDKYKDKKQLTAQDKKLLAELSKLTIYLDSLDEETYNLLRLSAPYIAENYDAPYFMDYLNRIKNMQTEDSNQAIFIGSLLVSVFENIQETFPFYDMDKIKDLVKYLYETANENTKAAADKICDLFVKKRYFGLNELYNQYNS